MKVTHKHHQQQVESFYSLLEQKDLPKWIELWSKEAQNDFPYSIHKKAGSLKGKNDIKLFWLNTLKPYARLSLTITEIFKGDNKLMVIVKVQNLIQGSPQQYSDFKIGLFEFNPDGFIKHYTEFFNPLEEQKAIDLTQNLKTL